MGADNLVFESHPGSEAHSTCYSISTWVLSQGYSCWDMKLTTNLHLLLRLRISATILYTHLLQMNASKM